MRLSIRNQLVGTVEAVATGQAMGAVKVRLAGGHEITAAITAESVRDLGLTAGAAAVVLIKATEVAIAAGAVPRISIRNQLLGVVTEVGHGTVMTRVKLQLDGGETLTASITRDAAEELGLIPGDRAVALIKSTEVGIALP